MAQQSRPVNVVQGGAEFDMLEPEGDYWGDQLQSDEVMVPGLTAPLSHSVNRVIASTADTGTRSGRRPIKPSGVATLPLLMITMCCLIGCIGADRCVPQQPVLCDGLMDLPGLAKVFKYPTQLPCVGKNATQGPVVQHVTLRLYNQNLVEWKTPAFDCSKWVNRATTQLSFFKDTKVVNTSREIITVSRDECISMARQKVCSFGTLTGHEGVFVTHNKLDIEYQWSCKPNHF